MERHLLHIGLSRALGGRDVGGARCVQWAVETLRVFSGILAFSRVFWRFIVYSRRSQGFGGYPRRILALSRVVAYRLYPFLVPSRVSRLRSRIWLKRNTAGVLSDPVTPFSGADMEPLLSHGVAPLERRLVGRAASASSGGQRRSKRQRQTHSGPSVVLPCLVLVVVLSSLVLCCLLLCCLVLCC